MKPSRSPARPMSPLSSVLIAAAVAAGPASGALAAQTGIAGSDTVEARRGEQGAGSVAGALRFEPTVPALAGAQGRPSVFDLGSGVGTRAVHPFGRPERMDFWIGAVVGGVVAYDDPFFRYRTDEGQVARTIVGAITGGLSGRPISRRDLIRYQLRNARFFQVHDSALWLDPARPVFHPRPER